ncbi:MAG: TonB-dependent siderophore receptor, partial [Kaistella sp.]
MKKQIVAVGMLLMSLSANAQMNFEPINDTIRIQEIEDINLHKTGNPNKAKALTAKSNLTVMENPQPIAIVTHEVIEQQQAKQLGDVLQNVNGLYITSSRGNSQDSFGGRGFNFGNDNIFKNGARVNSGVFPEVSGLERVEVLKGGNAMLYGNVSAGGVVNLITKKPRFNFGGSVALNAGSWNSYKPTVDFYGPISEKVAFRVNGAYETAESFRDVVESQKYYFNPSFLFNIGEKSQLIVEADYLKNDFTPDFGIGAIENKDKSYALNTFLPRNAFVGADWQYQNAEQATAGITFNHQFSEFWTLNTVASFQNYTKDYFSTERVTWTYDDANRLKWSRPVNRTYNEQNYSALQVNLNGEINTGKINHKILVGTDSDYGTADSYTYN